MYLSFDVTSYTESSRVLPRSTVLGVGASVGARNCRGSNLEESHGLAMRGIQIQIVAPGFSNPMSVDIGALIPGRLCRPWPA